MALRKKERAGLPRRYTFKLYPNKEQAEVMQRQMYLVGDLWNALLNWQESNNLAFSHDRAEKAHLSFFDMTAGITQLRAEFPEYAEMSVWTSHRVAYALEMAFQAFFSRAKAGAGAASGYPQYRSRRLQNWLPHRARSGFKMVEGPPLPEDPDVPGLKHEVSKRGTSWTATLKGVPGQMLAKGRFPGKPLAWGDVDIRLIDGVWWLSVMVDLAGRREQGDIPRVVRFDNLTDVFATLDGQSIPAWAAGLIINDSEDERADLQRRMAEAEFRSPEYLELKRRHGRLLGAIARRRKNALHVWTTEIVRSASALVVVKPASIKDETQSAKGDVYEPGAAVKTKAKVNKHVLAQAPAAAIAMLKYKALEAGIPFEEREAERPLPLNQDYEAVAKVVKTARKVRAQSKKVESNEHRERRAA